MNALLPILLILLFTSCAAGLVLQHIFLSRLRSRHLQTWEALGRPTLFLNNSITNSLAVLRFLWRGDYRALGDREFARFACFLRGYMAAYFVLFVLFIVVFMANSGSHR
jgi:hypothetical protein